MNGSKLLEGMERIHWMTTGTVCFAGALGAAMRWLGEPLSNDAAMGITGGAFKTFWRDPWNEANCDLLVMGKEPVRRAFAALGYGYTHIDDFQRQESREYYRDQVVRSIDHGVPVIAIGVVGPPEACVLTGYERGGEVMVGTSYFHEGDRFAVEDWYENIHGLILIGEKGPAPSPEQVLAMSLDWAITLARLPSFDSGNPPDHYINGLAAYDAFAAALQRDADFVDADPDTLRHHLVPISNDGICLQWSKREAAAKFLDEMMAMDPPGAEHLRAAAGLYREESALLYEAMQGLPYNWSSDTDARKIADPDYRRTLAGYLCRAKALDERAVESLEAARALLPNVA